MQRIANEGWEGRYDLSTGR